VTSPLFEQLRQQLLPLDQPLAGDIPFPGQAAVLVLISESQEPSLLFTKRAAHLRQHAGEVCFPGGMWEPGDLDLSATALRETWEEIGLPPSAINLLGKLKPGQTRAGTWVTPFVGSFNTACPFIPNRDELDSIFTIPLQRFSQGIQVRMDQFERAGIQYEVPVYIDQGYEIWGFTAAITARLLKRWVVMDGIRDSLRDNL
jgi:8-oxo-dGTP pyrophosphatase MutT (NUDIX family)